MQMDAGIDTGDMLYKKTLDIDPKDTYETLHDKLMVLGGEAIVEALALLEKGQLFAEKQEDSLSCYAPLIRKELGKLDFSRPAAELERLIRGLNPWPSAYTSYHGKQLKIWAAEVEGTNGDAVSGQDAAPGTIVEVTKHIIKVATGQGLLCISELQLEGKKRMSTHDFLLGVKAVAGEILG